MGIKQKSFKKYFYVGLPTVEKQLVNNCFEGILKQLLQLGEKTKDVQKSLLPKILEWGLPPISFLYTINLII